MKFKNKNALFILIQFLTITLMGAIFFSCEMFTVGLGDKVDLTPPTLDVEMANETYVSDVITITGDFDDDLGVASIALTINGVLQELDFSISEDQESWAVDIDTTGYDDGSKELVFKVTDKAKRSTTKTLILYFDNNDPVVLIKEPLDLSAIQNKDVTIRGEVADKFRIASVEVLLFDDEDNPIDWAQGGIDEENPNVILLEDMTNAWSFVFDSKTYTDLASSTTGTFRMQVRATDLAGNSNDYYYLYSELLAANDNHSFSVDELEILERTGVQSEGMELTATMLADEVNGYRHVNLDIITDQDKDLPQFFFDTPSFSSPTLSDNPQAFGKITDDDGVDVSTMEIRLNGGEWQAIDEAPDSDGANASWSQNLSDLGEGIFTLQIRAADIYGVSLESEVLHFIIDAAGPSLVIDSPSSGDYFNNSFTITGTAIDNLGVDVLQYNIDNGAYIDVITFDNDDSDESVDYTLNEETGMLEYDWSFDVTLPDDGSHMLRIRALDLGDKYTVDSLQVYLDSELPEIMYLSPQDSSVVNGSIQIQGTTRNQSPIESLVLSVSDGTTTNEYILNDSINELDRNTDLDDLLMDEPDDGTLSSYYFWYKNIDTLQYADNSDLTVTMSVLDAAGNNNSRSLTLSMDQSTDDPVLYFDNLRTFSGVTGEDNVFAGNPTLIGRVLDDDGVDLESIQVNINESGVWNDIVSDDSDDSLSINWSYTTVSLSEGDNSFQLRAKDKYDDPEDEYIYSAVIPFIVDNGAPTIEISEISWGSSSLTSGFQGAYVNDTVTISGIASDGIAVELVDVNINNEESGGETVYVNVYGSDSVADPPFSPVNWSFDLDISSYDEGDVSLKFRSSDLTDKVSYKDLILIKDTVGPEVEFTDVYGSAARASGLNGLLQFKGTGSDDNQVALVQYALISDDGTPTVADVSSGDWVDLSAQYSWSTWVDSTDMDDGDYVVFARAFDDSGNVTPDSDITANRYEFTLLQSTDNPYFSFSNLDEGGAAADNLIGLTKTTLTGKVYDDDGISLASVQITLDNGSNDHTETISFPPGTADGLTEYTWTYDLPDNTTLPQSAAPYSITLTASDIGESGGSLTKSSVSADSSVVSAYLDRTLPELSETAVGTTDLHISNSTVTLIGTASDGNELTTSSDIPYITISVNGGAAESIDIDEDGPDNIAGNDDDNYWIHTYPAVADGSTDGTYALVLTATDAAGRIIQLTRNMLIDATAPETLTIDAFTGSYQVNELVASGSASDATSGLSLVEYSLDNTNWFNATGTGSWFKTIDISGAPEGSGTLYVRATDMAGNVSGNTTAAFEIDRYNPVLTVEAAYDTTVYKSTDFIINGTVTDTLDVGSDPISVSVSGPEGDFTPTALYPDDPDLTNWNVTVPVTIDGSYTVTITASDNVNRTTTAVRTVVIDSEAPTLSGINLTEGASIYATSYTVTGLASDGTGSGVDKVQYQLNNSGTWLDAAGTDSWSIGLTGLTDNLNATLDFRTLDKAGNTSSTETRNFIVDTAPPTTTVSGVNTAFEYVNTAVNLSGSASDTNGIASVEVSYSLDGGATTDLIEGGTLPAWTASLPAGDGIYDITITVTDDAGRPSEYTRRVGIDTAAPTLTITAPVENEWLDASSNPYTLRGTVTDDGGKGVTHLEYSDTGDFTGEETSITLAGLNWSVADVDFSGGGEGSRTLYFRAGDGLNSDVTESVTFYYDEAAPIISETNLNTTDTQYASDDFVLSGVWTESNQLDEIRITYTKDGGASQAETILTPETNGTDVAWTYSVPVDNDNTGNGETLGIQDGLYVFTIIAEDVAKRTASLTRTVGIDTAAPTITPPASVSGYLDSSVSISGTSTDLGTGASGVNLVQYSIDGGTTWADASGTTNWSYTIDVSTMDEGAQTLSFRAIDKGGRISDTETTDIKVDHQAPRAVMTPTGSFTTLSSIESTNSSFTLSGTADDDAFNPGTQRAAASAVLSFTKDGGTATNITLSPAADGSWTWDSTDIMDDGSNLSLTDGSRDGYYVFTLTVTDDAAKVSTAQQIIRVDTNAPVLTVSTPSEDENVLVSSYTIRGTVTDNGGAGVSALQYSTNGTDWTDFTSISYSWSEAGLDFTGTDGARELHVRASDGLNSYTTETVNFYHDNTAPFLSLDAVDSMTNAVFTISGTATDAIALDSVRVSATLNGATQNLADPDGAGTEWVDDGNSIVNTDGSFSASYMPGVNIADGDWIFTVTATDGAGNYTTETISVEVDNSNPDAPVLSGAVADYYQNTLNLEGTASDSGSGIGRILYDIDAGTLTGTLNGTESWYGTINISSLGEGSHSISLTAEDRAGNQGNPLVQAFDVDHADPTVTVTGSWGSTAWQSSSFTISGTTSDSNGIISVTASDGGDDSTIDTVSGTTSWTVDVTPDTNGENTITLTVTDGVGRFSTEEIVYFYDVQEPQITAVNITNNQLFSSTSYTVVGQASDYSGSGIASVEYNLNSGGWTSTGVTGTETWTVSLSSLSDGSAQTIAFRTTDNAGNVLTTPVSRTFTVDTELPDIKPEIMTDRSAAFDFADEETLTTNMAFGGNSAQFALKILASDTNGIASVSVNIPGVGDEAASYVGDGTGAEAGYEIWTTGTIDVSGVSDGSAEWVFTVTDTPGQEADTSRTVIIDNSAPSLSHLTPAAGVDVLNGEIELKGTAQDNTGGSGLSAVQYQIGYNYDADPDSVEWTDVSGSLYNWKVDFTGVNKIDLYAGLEVTAVDTGTEEITIPSHGFADESPVWINGFTLPSGLSNASTYYAIYVDDDTLQLSLTAGGAAVDLTDAGSEFRISAYSKDSDNDQIWELPVIFRTIDEAGNISAEDDTSYVLLVDPSGDKPQAAIVYPDPDSTNRTMGGIIRIFGTAEDDDAVSAVYMQVDVDGDGDYDVSDVDSQGVNWYNGGDGVQVTGTYSWNQSLNEMGEFNPVEIGVAAVTIGNTYRISDVGSTTTWTDLGVPLGDQAVGYEFEATGTGTGDGLVELARRTIHFRVRVEDLYGTLGPWTESQEILIDKNVPKFGSTDALTINTASDGSGTGQNYVQDMWISGDWYILGSVEDESDITRIDITGDTTAAGVYNGTAAIEAASTYFTDLDDGDDFDTGYNIMIPVDTVVNQTGELNIEITAYDGSDPQQSTTASFTINYDNKAPVISAAYDDEIYYPSLDANSTSDYITYGGYAPVEQSNRTYQISGTVAEDGSGLERIAIYFQRDVNSNDNTADDKIYNPMEDDTGGANATDYSTMSWQNGLPRLEVTSATRPDEYSMTHSSLENNLNVREGGLIMVGGIDRLITEFNSVTGTVTWADAVNTGITTAYIAYALVVDNDKIETPVWSGDTLTDILNDDGDGLIESIERSGGSYEWSAYINSHNIPDGPIDIHWVSFDEAGNYAEDSVETQVLNNRPKLAQVILGTDLNGDGDTADTGEQVDPYSLTDGGENQAVATAASDDFIAKGDTTIEIEVVGGNGQLFYWITDDGDAAVSGHSSISLRDDEVSAINTIDLTDTQLLTLGEGDETLTIEIWDSTEETTPGTDSQWAQLTVPLVLDLVDEVSPHAVIEPFFWNDEDNNSLYGNSLNNGHIEITGVSGGTDPDVSGTISVRGTAYDDQRLSGIWLYIEDFDFNNAAGSGSNFDIDADGSDETLTRTYYQVASYTPGSGWTEYGTLATDGWEFSIVSGSESFSQAGHQVQWQLDWNTAFDNDHIAVEDIEIRVLAEDKRTNPNASAEDASQTASAVAVTAGSFVTGNTYQIETIGTTDFTEIGALENSIGVVFVATDSGSGNGTAIEVSPYYNVDILPYISDISRSTDYNTIRSRQGWYSFRRTEDVTVTGFNLYTGTNNTITFGGGTAVTVPGTSTTSFTVTIPADAVSGDITLMVNNLEAVNNSSDNSKPYNIEDGDLDDDEDGEDLWTDDRKAHIWQSDNTATGNNRGYFTGSDDPEYPAMSINGSGVLYGSWSNYAESDVYYAPNNGNAVTIFHAYDPLEHTDISFGNRVTVAMNINIYGNNNWDVRGAGGSYIWDAQADAQANWWEEAWSGTPYVGVYNAEALYHDEKLMQFINQRVVNDGNRIHHTYFDTDTKSLKYFYVLSNTATNSYNQSFINVDGGSDADDGTRLVAVNRSAAAGEYSAIDVNPNGYPVIAYYDITNRTVKLAYSSTTSPDESEWNLMTVMDTEDTNYEYSGKYISMRVDSDGYVHMVFFRNSTGDLIYLKSTNAPTNGSTAYTFGDSVIIDSAGSVGVWADITIQPVTGTNNDIPIISYLDSSLVNTFDGIKMAFYDPTLEVEAGDTADLPDSADGWEYLNAALGYEVESVRTSIENDTGSNFWGQAIGYSSTDYFRIAYYVD